MKKMFSLTAVCLVLCLLCGITAMADDTASVKVYVTIADSEGQLAVAGEPVIVTDIDHDGILTINDALSAAHDAFYPGGAESGYASSVGQYGLALDKLWGCENGGSYGYYRNNASAWSLTDVVSDGDFVNAFVYTDLEYWSDTYCFFQENRRTVTVGDALTLTLTAAGYDADFNPITVPVTNAKIIVNGNPTSFTTDENGSVTISLDAEGTYIISAVSENQNLVPPVCSVTAESMTPAETEPAAEEPAPAEPETEPVIEPETEPAEKSEVNSDTSADTESGEAAADNETTAPKTSDAGLISAILLCSAVILSGAVLVSRKKA